MSVISRAVPVFSLIVVLLPPARAVQSEKLRPDESIFLYAAALMVADPKDRESSELQKHAADLAYRKDQDVVAGDDPILKALVRIAEEPDLRETYRRDVQRRLKAESREQLIAEIRKDFDRERLGRYREVIREQRFQKGALPWPLCIPFKCCQQ